MSTHTHKSLAVHFPALERTTKYIACRTLLRVGCFVLLISSTICALSCDLPAPAWRAREAAARRRRPGGGVKKAQLLAQVLSSERARRPSHPLRPAMAFPPLPLPVRAAIHAFSRVAPGIGRHGWPPPRRRAPQPPFIPARLFRPLAVPRPRGCCGGGLLADGAVRRGQVMRQHVVK